MAEEDSSQEKTEEPTSRKLEKTREEGNVVRSKELNTSAILIVSAICILVFGPLMGNTLMEVMRFCFDFDARASWDTNISGEYFLASIYAAFTALLPFFALLLLTALAAPMSLGGWNFSTKALAPKASRMNPFSGLKRMFSMNSLVELLKGWAGLIL